jgi:hypothetical protein
MALLLLLLKMCHTTIVTDSKEDLSTDLKYKVIITNKRKSPIYFRDEPDLYSCGMYANEKIYYITSPIHRKRNRFKIQEEEFIDSFSIETKIDSNETKVFRVRGDVNNKNLRYERDKELGITESQHLEFVTDVHFLFFFTRNPYRLKTYTEYIEAMENDGYAVLGYRDENEFYFTITDTEMKVNDDAINDLSSFVYSIQERMQNKQSQRISILLLKNRLRYIEWVSKKR